MYFESFVRKDLEYRLVEKEKELGLQSHLEGILELDTINGIRVSQDHLQI